MPYKGILKDKNPMYPGAHNTETGHPVIAYGIAHLYNNWKWPYEVFMQLNSSIRDIGHTLISMTKISAK
jgi:hypothetical protein